MSADFPLNFLDVTREIERVREAAGRDVVNLAVLSQELERSLREAAPGEPELARYAHVVLDGYLNLARHGFFPEIFREEEL